MYLPAAPRSVNQQRQQQINRTLVINLLRWRGLCSRAELAKLSGLQPATLTNIVSEFIECGLVIEKGLLEGDKGRRAIGVCINGNRFRVLGVMITRTSYSIIDMGLSGEVFNTYQFSVEKHVDATELIEDICENLAHIMMKSTQARILAIGFAIPGPYMDANGKIAFITNLSGWDSIPLYEILQEKFDIPVFVENDANAGALAQFWFRGQEHLSDNLIYVVAGQGIGCGIFSAGALLKGDFGIAGEIGHTTICYDGPQCECGNRGCLEKYCSTLVLRERLRERMARKEDTLLPEQFTLADIAFAIRAKNPAVCEEYVRVCDFLAIGLISLVNQLNPSTIIIGDELADLAPELMLSTVNRRMQKSVHPMIWERLTIETSSLSHSSILMGAGVTAAMRVFGNPFTYIQAEKGGA